MHANAARIGVLPQQAATMEFCWRRREAPEKKKEERKRDGKGESKKEEKRKEYT